MDAPRRLAGRYELRRVLGRGGMAEVYLGHDTRLGRTVAVKTLLPELARDPEFQTRFRREAQSAASLNHSTIVAVYDTGENVVEGVSIPYIVMEYVQGATLRERLRSGGTPSPARAFEIGAGLLRALEYSHRAGIVHRDIKPGNVMLTDTGEVKVMDFGIARALGSVGMTMTGTATVMGTAHYLSPEQARGEKVDARSDLYSAGCLLYELLTEQPPFVGDSPVSVAYQHVNAEPQAPSALGAAVDAAADAVVLRALAKDREERYQSAAEMRADIEAVLAGRPSPASRAAAEAVTTRLGATPSLTVTTSLGAVPGSPGDQRPPATGATSGTGSTPATGASPPTAPRRRERGDEPSTQRSEERGGRRRRGSRVPAVLAGVATLLLLVGAVAMGRTLMGDDDDGGERGGGGVSVTVPDLRGMTLAEARERAAGDFEVARGDSRPCAEAEDTVCDTDPTAGSRIDSGSTVTLIMSAGDGPVAVPDVTGETYDAAEAELQAAGLRAERQPVDDPGQAAPGTVLGQDPASGTEVTPGTTVTLTVAEAPTQTEGPDPTGEPDTDPTGEPDTDPTASTSPTDEPDPEPVAVPEVTGLSYDDAERVLTDAGLRVERVVSDEHHDVPEDTVLHQDPAAGVEVASDELVTLTVEPPYEQVVVPDVAGLAYQEAKTELLAAGLEPSPHGYPDAATGCEPTDLVDHTTPAGGETVDEGSSVDVYCTAQQTPPPSRAPGR